MSFSTIFASASQRGHELQFSRGAQCTQVVKLAQMWGTFGSHIRLKLVTYMLPTIM